MTEQDPRLVVAQKAVELLRQIVSGVTADDGAGGFSLWADIEGYEWLSRAEGLLKEIDMVDDD